MSMKIATLGPTCEGPSVLKQALFWPQVVKMEKTSRRSTLLQHVYRAPKLMFSTHPHQMWPICSTNNRWPRGSKRV